MYFSFQFRFASCGDVALIFLGILMACANGCALPCMIIVFGDMIDSFIDDGSASNFLGQIPWEKFNTTREAALADENIMK